MGEVIATVDIRQDRREPRLLVCFEFPRTGESVFLPLSERATQGLQRRASKYLTELVSEAARLNIGDDRAVAALLNLFRKGVQLAFLLTQNDGDRVKQLAEAFRAAWPMWQAEDWSDARHDVPIIEMRCGDHALPLELLPIFDLSRPPEIRNYDDVVRLARRFVGFATVVRRIVRTRMTVDHVLRNEPALPVQFMRHRGLPSAREEEHFLASLGDRVQVEGPWPLMEDDNAVRAALVRALYDGSRLDGNSAAEGDPPVQMHHFACHCDTTPEFDDDYKLELSTRNGRVRKIKFEEIRQGYIERIVEQQDSTQDRAVIILNACASSRTNPLTAYSFPDFFLRQGHRAFIGTETDVPDSVASAFSRAFYGRLLEAKRPLGEAVVWARRDLLRDFRNPLGLLYVMYGDTQLTVERARPGIYRASAGRSA
ncbi:CHAT domain-containing protein [Catellatospora vulcania]|uniref:CHAT domain-containing protein n=1 Tax=Catellatospora vulcania TaxID=1460450 RepID=UPI0012D3C49B|nr:CHAT domain-containing protein [Catellatospora vulcania]